MFYYPSRTQGSQKNVKVYDTTGVAAANNFVSKLHSSLTPPAQVWAMFEASDEVPEDEQHDVNLELKNYTERMFSFIRRSNFDLVIQECYYDLAVGTAVLVINDSGDDESPLTFSSIPLDQVSVEESINHLLETVFRTWGEVRIDDIQMMWPKAKLSQTMQIELRDNPNAMVTDLIEGCIYNHSDKKTPYTYVLWHKEDVLFEEKLESSPFVLFRWSKINNEAFGRGVIMQALPSLISLQTAAYFEFAAANLNIAKPLMAYSDGIFNPYTFEMKPNTVIPVSPNSAGQWPIQPFPDTISPQLFQLTASDLRQQINTLMFANPLGPITQAPDRTATELALRQRNFAEEIGPPFTRLQQEFMPRMLKRISYILNKRGVLKKPKLKNNEIRIQYKSPLVINQNQADVQSSLQYFQLLQGVLGPEQTLIFMNTIKYPEWLAEKMGVDPNIINSSTQVAAQLQEVKNKMDAEKMQQQQGMMNEQQ